MQSPIDSPRTCSRKAFTLIELSIVLVIIGLIVGGILIGRDLVDAASIRKEISQFQQVLSAVNTFRTKYNCLPGDCASATQFFTGVTNGDNDGRMTGSTWPGTESFQFWVHLSKAGLIAGNYQGANWSDALPGTLNANARFLALYWPTTWYVDAAHNYDAWTPHMDKTSWGNALSIFDPSKCSVPKGGATAAQAYAIDTKMDDGLPASGKIVQYDPWTGGSGCDYWGGCVTGLTVASAQYLTSDTVMNHCTVIYTNAF